jgi:hypothetical protein
MNESPLIEWLLAGDVSIQYQVYRDLLGADRPDLRERIASEGWGAELLQRRHPAGHWGRGFYQPKWISTHYTLLELKHLGIVPANHEIQGSISLIHEQHKGQDGGINPGKTIQESDVCVNGMFLNYACYFRMAEEPLRSIVDLVITLHMPDGGFNCRANRGGAVHSSLHSTISVLEGILDYDRNGYRYRLAELGEIAGQAREFILQHRLYRSDRTGKVIDQRFLLLSYPPRWYYDILRALDYFQAAGVGYDPRMGDALDVLRTKRRKDGTWPLQGKHPGETHFEVTAHPAKAGRFSNYACGNPLRWRLTDASHPILRIFKAAFTSRSAVNPQ